MFDVVLIQRKQSLEKMHENRKNLNFSSLRSQSLLFGWREAMTRNTSGFAGYNFSNLQVTRNKTVFPFDVTPINFIPSYALGGLESRNCTV